MSPELLQAIGELTLRYAQLDGGLGFIAADLLHCQDFDIAEEMFKSIDISRKSERVRWLFNYYHRREEWWSDDLHRELLEWLDRCNKLIEHRNDIVHGAVESDDTAGQQYFVRKGRRRSADVGEVQQLNQKIVHELAIMFNIMYTINRRFEGEGSDSLRDPTAPAKPE
jgi:hypothetical protein